MVWLHLALKKRRTDKGAGLGSVLVQHFHGGNGPTLAADGLMVLLLVFAKVTNRNETERMHFSRALISVPTLTTCDEL